MKNNKTKKGFGIMEVLISATIIIIILGALVLIAHTAMNNIQHRQIRAEALYLAQEGLETVRQIRDTNWIDKTTNTKWDTMHIFDDSNAYANPLESAGTGCYYVDPTTLLVTADDGDQLRRLSLHKVLEGDTNINHCKTLGTSGTYGSESVPLLSNYPLNPLFQGYTNCNGGGPLDRCKADKEDTDSPNNNTFYRSIYISRSLGQLLPTVSDGSALTDDDIHSDLNAFKVTVFVGYKFGNSTPKTIEVSEILTNWRPNF